MPMSLITTPTCQCVEAGSDANVRTNIHYTRADHAKLNVTKKQGTTGLHNWTNTISRGRGKP